MSHLGARWVTFAGDGWLCRARYVRRELKVNTSRVVDMIAFQEKWPTATSDATNTFFFQPEFRERGNATPSRVPARQEDAGRRGAVWLALSGQQNETELDHPSRNIRIHKNDPLECISKTMLDKETSLMPMNARTNPGAPQTHFCAGG